MIKSLTAWKVFNLFLLVCLLMNTVRAFKTGSYEPLMPLFAGWVGGDILANILKNLFWSDPPEVPKNDNKDDLNL